MCFFKKKSAADVAANDREMISMNEKQIASLIVLAGQDEAFIEELKAVREQIKFLTPSTNGKVVDYDKKIKGIIEDLKIVLTKASGEPLPQKANNLLTQIKLCITDRNVIA